MSGSQNELPLSETQFLIMASLITPAHGYGIMQNVESMTEGRVAIGPGTMYGTLKKLLKRHHITQLDQDTRRIRYVLTESGRKLLNLETDRLRMLAAIGDKLNTEDVG